MKIWIISDGEPLPTDNENVRLRRMGNLANILSERGNEVVWFSSNFEHYNKQFRTDHDEVKSIKDNYKIVLLKTNGYKKNVSLNRLLHFKTFSDKFLRIASQLEKPDIILSTMAPIQASKAVQQYALEYEVPYVIDIRDLWPEIYYEVTPKLLHPLVKLLVEKNKKTLEEVLKNSTAIVGVTEKFLEYGLNIGKILKRSDDTVFHTAYPDILDSNEKTKKYWNELGIENNDFIVTFVGNFGKQFDLKTLFKAIDLIDNKRMKFVLCGVGEKFNYYYEKYQSNPQVIMPGWVGKNEIATLLKLSSVGVAPYVDSINFRLNMPNKFGEYLSASLPILVSVPGMMEEKLNENKNGHYYKNEYELRDKIIELYKDFDLLKRMSKYSRELYKNQFNVDIVYTEFAQYLENIAKQ
ncbi:hypothetical protein BU046_11925 [Staphylococcus simulans]|uniref:glycosyltransferase family 4 protein n=1 Tax=Staphylococcus simulans TaxID=1286 RepID=UPI000D1E773F|nr:glycosyltransferase family 4 protein [Staphylococcus simulans]PTJ02683.1 hypothetical protein BU046_11925 [Staphylococcus simulans]